jgi:hypothetical protein
MLMRILYSECKCKQPIAFSVSELDPRKDNIVIKLKITDQDKAG